MVLKRPILTEAPKRALALQAMGIGPNDTLARPSGQIVPVLARRTKARAKGKTLMSRVREIMKMPSNRNGAPRGWTRFDDCSNAFVMAMETGSFVHMKEFIDREEGKVPTRLSDADGGNLKLYVGMPIDEAEGAP